MLAQNLVMTSCNRIFNRFSNSSTVALWNSNIRSTVDSGHSQKALLLFSQMKQSGIQPDKLTFPFVAKACARLSNLLNSEIVHTQIVKSPFSSDIFVQTAMVDMYVKCHYLNSAHDVFEEMPERDIVSWNAIIAGFSQLGTLDRALDLFHRMRLADFKPDSITIISLSQSSANANDLNAAKAVHSLGVCIGIESDTSVANTWISAYGKCGDFGSAEFVFNGISIAVRTVVSWNSMIAGYAHLERFDEVIYFFCQMRRDGIRPDLSTTLSLLSSCAQSEALLQGQLIHCCAMKEGFELDVSVINTLISLYSKCGDVASGRFLFDTMLDRTCVSWTAMIGGYAQNGDVNEALDLFESMEAAGEKPDAVTVVALLSACNQTGALELGQWVNRYAAANGLLWNVMVCNALVDMYAKCGCTHDARRLFDSISRKTVVSWTTMIAGYAMNGESEEAFDLFSQMLESGLKPNHITFLAVLQACTHSGFLEKGWEYFNFMIVEYQLSPRLEHYACMVDLLGRSGKVKQALDFVRNMPVEPDAGVWGAVLGACRIYNEIELGEYVADHLFMIEPQAAVSYVVMANIYATAGRWEGVAKIRAMMKCKGVKKLPGHSHIRVNGKVHVFTVEDRHHPEGLQISEILEELALHLKETGFKPILECILLDECE